MRHYHRGQKPDARGLGREMGHGGLVALAAPSPGELAGLGIRIPRMDIEWLDVVEADRLAPDGHARERVRRCQCSAQGRLNPICTRSSGLGHASR